MKHLKYILLLVLLGSLILVACGGDEPEEVTDIAETDTGEAMGEEEKITLRLWSHQNAAFWVRMILVTGRSRYWILPFPKKCQASLSQKN